MLAGKWNASLWTRFLNQLFFGIVWIQKRFNITRPVFRRDRDAGYPTETRSKDPRQRANLASPASSASGSGTG
jgi:hypothetical protein